MSVNLWENKGHIYLSIYHNKKLWRESTGLKTSKDKAQNKEILKLAEIIRSKREMQLIAAKHGIVDTTKKGVALYDYIIEVANLKTEVAANQSKKVLPYLDEFDRDILLSAVTPRWFSEFKSFMEKTEKLKSDNTKAKYLSVVREALKTAVREQIIPMNPTDGIPGIRSHDGNRQALSETEVRTLIECTSYTGGESFPEIRQGFIFALHTGLRISDIRQLRYKHIDINKMQIVKQQKKTKDFVYIPITQKALETLGELGAPEDLIFPYLASVEDISFTNRSLKAWGIAAGLTKKVTWHIARHTYATQLIESGADVYIVQKLLGQAHIQTTQKYAKVSDLKKRQAVESLPEY